jgi:hypothetical protein
MEKVKTYLRQQAEIYGLRQQFVDAIDAIGTHTAREVRSELSSYATDGHDVDAYRMRRCERMIENLLADSANAEEILAYHAGYLIGEAARAMGHTPEYSADLQRAETQRVRGLLGV